MEGTKKKVSCRLGISRLVLVNRTGDLHVQKPAANILNMQLCTTDSGWSCLLGFADAENLLILKENTLMSYRRLCNMLNMYRCWSRMACIAGHGNEPSGSVKGTEILDQSFGPYVFTKAQAQAQDPCGYRRSGHSFYKFSPTSSHRGHAKRQS